MTHSNKRIQLLDMWRGFAILGTLGTNIWLFANLGDLSYTFGFDRAPWWTSFDEFVRVFTLFLVNGKFLGMLTILFGVGLELKYRQALRKGNAWPGIYLWISLILLAEGLIHFTLVMEYDILMSYAVTAMIVSLIVKFGDRAIKSAMWVFGGFHLLGILLLLGVILYSNLVGGQVSMGDMTQVVTLYQNGTWLEQLQYRLTDFWVLRLEVIFVIPMNIFLFLLGVRLMRSGAFSSDDHGKHMRRKMLRIGLFIGIPLNLLLFVPGGAFDLLVRYLFSPFLAVGYMGLIAMLVEKTPRFWLWSSVEKVGKMALSCYVLQNVVSSILFYGWGLGLGGQVDAVTTVAIWFGISLFQLGFAWLWLQLFRSGPMETFRRYLAAWPTGGRMNAAKTVSSRSNR
ncbi:DUF418 domain-containing protein [Desmospora activa]|uniref:DUF418 domain-containing protein n=1 Tax=Desmospora activa DSM 45169 TaxID=1121389 RepID=A0A2T4Z7S1_9BACL|nr:DUF418 domain-containing protein [Desmospora activa]PTM57930.1 uncharacterized protein C8J48_0499 [Desmospora activa DSM 45169]